MDNKEINSIIMSLSETMFSFETLLIENDGEFTEEAQQLDEQIELLKSLLTTDGIDSLGRWLKSKEDEIKTLKAEKDYITRKINASNNTIDYIKSQMYKVLLATGNEEIKGANGYSFKAIISRKTEVDKTILKDTFQAEVEKKLRSGKKPILPPDVTISLGASVTAVPEGTPLPMYYSINETPTCTFKKPRASK